MVVNYTAVAVYGMVDSPVPTSHNHISIPSFIAAIPEVIIIDEYWILPGV